MSSYTDTLASTHPARRAAAQFGPNSAMIIAMVIDRTLAKIPAAAGASTADAVFDGAIASGIAGPHFAELIGSDPHRLATFAPAVADR